jgi:hypothetical protein
MYMCVCVCVCVCLCVRRWKELVVQALKSSADCSLNEASLFLRKSSFSSRQRHHHRSW